MYFRGLWPQIGKKSQKIAHSNPQGELSLNLNMAKKNNKIFIIFRPVFKYIQFCF